MVLKPAPAPVGRSFTTATVVGMIRAALWSLPDLRKGGNNQRYAIGDAALSAFSVFFLQSPSFLDYQRRMQQERGRNNAHSLFGVHQIPSTQQIGNLLDPVAPAHLAPVLVGLVEALAAAGELATHRVLDGRLPVALDGTQYHRSTAIHCPQCATRTLANGKTQYHHAAVTPTIVAPEQAAVFPLPPQFVQPQDGQAKQDCERNAAGRWLHRWGAQLAAWRVLVLGDDLYCHQPFCQQVLTAGLCVPVRVPAHLPCAALRVGGRLHPYRRSAEVGEDALDRPPAPDRYLPLAQ